MIYIQPAHYIVFFNKWYIVVTIVYSIYSSYKKKFKNSYCLKYLLVPDFVCVTRIFCVTFVSTQIYTCYVYKSS